MTACELGDSGWEQYCHDGVTATHLKWVSIGIILFMSVVGISSPVVLACLFEGKPTYMNALLLIKCFATGVILSTLLVHILPDAFDALANCQLASRHPWHDFPFSSFIALIGALIAFLVDVSTTSHTSAAAATASK